MDYIQKGILDRIQRLHHKNSPNVYSTMSQYYRILFEYHLFLMFACLWDRKENVIPREMRLDITKKMEKPILGTTLSYIMEMDRIGESVFHIDDGYMQTMRRFIHIRNTCFGHTAILPNVQEGKYKEICADLERCYKALQSYEDKFFGSECEFRLRQMPDSGQLTVFLPDRNYEYRDVDPRIAAEFTCDELYYSCAQGNFCISPFILVQEQGVDTGNYEIFCFSGYKLASGTFAYYLISEFRDNYEYSKSFPDFFTSYKKTSEHTICRSNGVISNRFDNNYDYFINIPPFTGYVTQIWDFLKRNKSNTCLTIRGGGGIGKTALVHFICTKYLFESTAEEPLFRYVIFCSAKDREFRLDSRTERGTIRAIDPGRAIGSYRDILRTISRVLELSKEPDSDDHVREIEEAFLQEKGILLIIDDYETLSNEDKAASVELINRMQIDRHKVLITTRSQYLIGSAYDVRQMDEDQIIAFMTKRFEKLLESNPRSDACERFREFQAGENRHKIFALTQGLPLLAIQFVTLLQLNGFSSKILQKDWKENAEDFLLGRLYSYFHTFTSKLLFLIIAFFVKYGQNSISLDVLEIFYKLYCARFDQVDVDFQQDLNELKNLSIIRVESDYIQISSNISAFILDQCIQSFHEEYADANTFDEKLFKIAAQEGVEQGILDYALVQNADLDIHMVNLFALENVLKYTKEYRFQLLDIFLQQCKKTSDMNGIRDVYARGKKYFPIDQEYAALFRNYGVEAEQPNADTARISPLISLEKEFEQIRDDADALLGNRSNTRAYINEQIQKLRERIGILCNVKLKEALHSFSAEDQMYARNIHELILEISQTKQLDCRNNESYKYLLSLLS